MSNGAAIAEAVCTARGTAPGTGAGRVSRVGDDTRADGRGALPTLRPARGPPARSERPPPQLWSALDWSFQLLTPELQRFFASLSVFRGGWTVEAARSVCEEPQALAFLEELRACSLIRVEEPHATADTNAATDAAAPVVRGGPLPDAGVAAGVYAEKRSTTSSGTRWKAGTRPTTSGSARRAKHNSVFPRPSAGSIRWKAIPTTSARCDSVPGAGRRR